MITDGSTNSSQITTTANSGSNTAAFQIANAISQTSGQIDLRTPMPLDFFIAPKSTLVTTKGRNAADNANGEVQAYVFNTDVYNTSILTADGTPGYAANYNDGIFGGVTGKNIGRHILSDQCGRGLNYYAITFVGKNAEGNQDITVLQNMQLEFQTYRPIGGAPFGETVDVGSAIRNTQFQSGILTVLLEGWINGQTQASWVVSSGCTITANFMWM